MQKLIIKNLGPIKDCEIELKPFTVLIGESGSGKSIILRTISMVKWIFKKMQYKNLLKVSKVKSDSIRLSLDKILKDAMLKDYFNNDTYIEFLINNQSIIIIDKKLQLNYKNLSLSKFTLSKIIFLNENRTIIPELRANASAKRSRFSYYTEDMIENFTTAFDEIGENFKLYTVDIKLESSKAAFGNKQIFVNRNNKKIKFENSSSGEKSAAILEVIASYFAKNYELSKNFDDNIYMLLVNNSLFQKDKKDKLLKFLDNLTSENNLTLLIEEPETNLFPSNQRQLIYFLAFLQKAKNNPEIIFSTHSPYILTSLNNLLYAAELSSKTNLKSKINKIIPSEYQINIDNFQAYMVKDNFVSSIMDRETNLINAEYIDAISNEIMNDFDKLYELE